MPNLKMRLDFSVHVLEYESQDQAESAAAYLRDGTVVVVQGTPATTGTVSGGVITWGGSGAGFETYDDVDAAEADLGNLADGTIVFATAEEAVNIVEGGAFGTWSDQAAEAHTDDQLVWTAGSKAGALALNKPSGYALKVGSAVALADGAGAKLGSWSDDVLVMTPAQFRQRSNGSFDGQVIQIDGGHIFWVWVAALSAWIPSPLVGSGTLSILETLSGQDTTGWTVAQSGGGSVTPNVSLLDQAWIRFQSPSSTDTANILKAHANTGAQWMFYELYAQSIVRAGSTFWRGYIQDGSRILGIDPSANKSSGNLSLMGSGGDPAGGRTENVTADSNQRSILIFTKPSLISSATQFAHLYVDHRLVATSLYTSLDSNTTKQIAFGDGAGGAGGCTGTMYIRNMMYGMV